MRPECINAVSQAIGRPITQAEARGIEDKLVETMRRLASKDPGAWMRMPKAERLRQAADMAAKDLEHAAELKERRAALTVQAHAKHVPEVERAGQNGFNVIQKKLDQADAYVKGVHRQYLTQVLDAIDYATRQDTGSLATRGVRWIANLENPERSLAFVREIFGKDTGDAGAKAAAKAWLESVEAMRQRFNAAGGDVRKLSYGYLPQPHDGGRIREAGIEAWVRDVLPMVDRSRYTNPDGRPMSDADLGRALEEAWRTIASDGWTKIEPGVFRGQSALANAGSQARVIHFATPEAYVEYLGKYGAGTVFDALSGHLGWMAKNIGLTEEFGPNPAALFRTMHDTAQQAGGTDRVALLMNTEDMWKTLTGEINNPQSQTAARIGQGVRNIQVFGKLAGALLSSVTDIPTYFTTLGYNRLGFWQGTVNWMRSAGAELNVLPNFLGGDIKEFADLAGLIAESKISDMNRWAEGHVGQGWTAKLAGATMKASFMNAWTDSLRRGFSVTMMGGMGRIAKTPWDQLEQGDRARLQAKGWAADDWAVVQRAEPEMWRRTRMLTPQSISRIEDLEPAARDRVISKLLGTITDEAEYASLAPDLATRTLQTGGLQKGTGKGELWRSIMLFKSFPVAMITRHWNRALNGDMSVAGKLSYSAALAFGMTLFGALALQLKDLVAGRDPRDMTGDMGDDPAQLVKFWTAAFAQGGGAGFLGDMLLSGEGRGGQSGASAAISGIVGPVVGSAFELGYDVILENVREAAQGKDTYAGAEAWRWARGHLPAINLWYARLAIDQAMLNQMQEALSPGYLAKVQARAQRDWDSTYWWEPSDTGLLTGDMSSPERGPALERAIGE